MKKLLLIGAMLIVGATSFSEVLVKLTEDNKGEKIKYTGQGAMEVTSKGSIIDPANRLVLVVEPSVSTGADHTALAFDFDKLFKGETRIRESEFIAQVLKNKTPIPLDNDGVSAISADLDAATKGKVLPLVNDNRDKIGAISYAMSGGSGLTNNNTVYKGRVLAQIAIGRDESGNNITDVKTGSFTHSSSSIKVTLTDLNVK